MTYLWLHWNLPGVSEFILKAFTVNCVFQKSEGKLAGAYAGLDDDDEPKKKKRKMTTHHVKPTVGARWRAADVSAVTKVRFVISFTDDDVVSDENHSISQPPMHPCFAQAIELIAHPKITLVLSFSWWFS